MDKYLVRWKYGAHTMLNDRDTDTQWYSQFHPDKESALYHHGQLASCKITGMEVELIQLRRLTVSAKE